MCVCGGGGGDGGGGGGQINFVYVSIYNEYVYLNSKKTNQIKYMASINLNIWHG